MRFDIPCTSFPLSKLFVLSVSCSFVIETAVLHQPILLWAFTFELKVTSTSYVIFSHFNLASFLFWQELLALGERMGTVSTALTEEAFSECLKTSIYESTPMEDVSTNLESDKDDIRCSICQVLFCSLVFLHSSSLFFFFFNPFSCTSIFGFCGLIYGFHWYEISKVILNKGFKA